MRGALPWLVALGLAGGCADGPQGGDPADAGLSAQELLDPEACAECHPDHYRQWSGSMHAYAAENPIFHAMVRRSLREDPRLGDYCVRCHAPMAVILGLSADGSNLAEVPRFARGVTCAFCHTVTPTERVHGGAGGLIEAALDGVMRGGIADPLHTDAHESAYSAARDRRAVHESSEMCGVCHDVVTPDGVHVRGVYQSWRATIYATDDPGAALSCGGCHMPGRPGLAADEEGVSLRRVKDHAVPGVSLAVGDFPQAEAQRAAVQRALDSSLFVEVCVRLGRRGAEVEIGLENIAGGHGFPLGSGQYRRLWVEVRVFAGDAVVYESGVPAEGQPVSALAASDPDLWLLAETIYDPEGAAGPWASGAIVELPAASPIPPGSPGYVNVHATKRYQISGVQTPDRVQVRVRVRPFGLDVIDALVRLDGLDPAVRDRIPTFDLATGQIDWTEARAQRRISALSGREVLCVSR